jgi:hypothetical protein
MEEMLCAMALKSANGRQNHHTLSGICVCRERALKGAGERNTHNQVGAGTFGKPPARGTLSFVRASTSGIQRRFGGGGGGGGGATPCWQIADRVVGRAASPLAARCARDVLADHNPNIIYYITSHARQYAATARQHAPGGACAQRLA